VSTAGRRSQVAGCRLLLPAPKNESPKGSHNNSCHNHNRTNKLAKFSQRKPEERGQQRDPKSILIYSWGEERLQGDKRFIYYYYLSSPLLFDKLK